MILYDGEQELDVDTGWWCGRVGVRCVIVRANRKRWREVTCITKFAILTSHDPTVVILVLQNTKKQCRFCSCISVILNFTGSATTTAHKAYGWSYFRKVHLFLDRPPWCNFSVTKTAWKKAWINNKEKLNHRKSSV
jgi:hypothetical protein